MPLSCLSRLPVFCTSAIGGISWASIDTRHSQTLSLRQSCCFHWSPHRWAFAAFGKSSRLDSSALSTRRFAAHKKKPRQYTGAFLRTETPSSMALKYSLLRLEAVASSENDSSIRISHETQRSAWANAMLIDFLFGKVHCFNSNGQTLKLRHSITDTGI